MKKAKLIATLIFLGVSLVGSVFGQQVQEPLFHFAFDGHLKDTFGRSVLEMQEESFYNRQPIVEAAKPAFEENALSVDGEATWKSYVVRAPLLNFDKFTIVSRFKPFESCSGQLNIVTGGYWLRWFTVFRDNSRKLCVGFSNEDIVNKLPVTIESGKWYLLVCRLDLKDKTVRVSINEKDYKFNLPDDFVVSPLRPKWKKKNYDVKEKHFMFDNRGNGRRCQAYIDDFCVFNGLVAPKDVNLLVQCGRLANLIEGKIVAEHQITPDEFKVNLKRQMDSKLKRAGLPSNDQGLKTFLAGFAKKESADKTVDELVRQLGDRRFRNREMGHARLSLVGLPSIPYLKKVKRLSRDPEIRYRAGLLLKQSPNHPASSANVDFTIVYLSNFPDRNYIPYLRSCLIAAESVRTRIKICETVRACADDQSKALIREFLNDSNPWVRAAAILSSAKLKDSRFSSSKIRPFLSDPEELVQLCATGALHQQYPREVRKLLRKLQQSDENRTQILAGIIERRISKSSLLNANGAQK